MYSLLVFVFFFKQKTAYELRISDWCSDVCSSDLSAHRACDASARWHEPCREGICRGAGPRRSRCPHPVTLCRGRVATEAGPPGQSLFSRRGVRRHIASSGNAAGGAQAALVRHDGQYCGAGCRSEEHTSELQSLMRISYAVFCLKKKKNK